MTARRPLRERRPSGSAMRFDDDEPTTIVLVRHGETEATVSRAMSGSAMPGPSLSPTGRVQAAQAADLVFRIGRAAWTDLPHPDAVVCSPLARTRETATAIGRRLGANVREDARARECDYGAWEGRTPAEIEADAAGSIRAWFADPARPAPGGESLVDVGARMAELLDELAEANRGHSLVLVAHVMAIRAGVGQVLAMPASAWGGLRVPAASVTILRLWADGDRELVCLGMPPNL